MKAALLGKKVGMTSFFTEDGTAVPCTVIEAGPCPVTQVKTVESDGYNAIQVGFEQKADKNTNKPEAGHFAKAGVKPLRVLKEFRDPAENYEVGQELTVEQFEVGDRIKISGKTKGKGFQGVVKRHSFSGVGMATHGQKDRQRHPGSIGQSSDPSRVLKGTRMAGRMGGNRISVRNLEVVGVMPEDNLLLVKGSVPGARNSYLEILKK
jgi:large subunit ribosomal protein L3